MSPRRTKNVTICCLCHTFHTARDRKKELYEPQERWCIKTGEYVKEKQKTCEHFEWASRFWCPEDMHFIEPKVCINRQTKDYRWQCTKEKCKIGRMIITSYPKSQGV